MTSSRQLPTLRQSRPDAVSADDCDPGRTLPMLAATAPRRAEWLSDRLAEAVQRDGLRALIDDQWGVDDRGNAVRLGEQIRALVTLEGAERDCAAHLGLQLAKLGLDIATVRSAAVAKQARQMAALAQALCEEVAWTGATMPRGGSRSGPCSAPHGYSPAAGVCEVCCQAASSITIDRTRGHREEIV